MDSRDEAGELEATEMASRHELEFFSQSPDDDRRRQALLRT